MSDKPPLVLTSLQIAQSSGTIYTKPSLATVLQVHKTENCFILPRFLLKLFWRLIRYSAHLLKSSVPMAVAWHRLTLVSSVYSWQGSGPLPPRRGVLAPHRWKKARLLPVVAKRQLLWIYNLAPLLGNLALLQGNFAPLSENPGDAPELQVSSDLWDWFHVIGYHDIIQEQLLGLAVIWCIQETRDACFLSCSFVPS